MSGIDFTLGRHEVILREPFITALRTVERYPVITYTVSDQSGISGSGEAVATPAIVGDSLEEIENDLNQRITPALQGVTSLKDGVSILSQLKVASSSKAAADIALHSYFAAKDKKSLANSFLVGVERIRTDVTVPVAENHSLEKIVNDRLEEGFSSLKIKLKSQALEKNLESMKVTHALADGKATLRVDPNQAWTLDYSIAFLEGIANLDIEIEYLEQPVPRDQISALAQLHRLNLSPIMADESLFTIEDLELLISMKACSWVNVKLVKSGGLAPALAIARRAASEGLNVSVGSMMEGAGGVQSALVLAAHIAPELTHDLDAAWWHQDGAITYRDGWVEL